MYSHTQVLKASSSPLRVVGSASRSVVFLASGSLQQEVGACKRLQGLIGRWMGTKRFFLSEG